VRTLRLVLATTAACLLTVATSEAALITLDFDELTSGTTLDTEYAANGVTFSNSAGALIVQTATPGAPFTAPNAVLPLNYSAAGNFNEATFSSSVSFVSVVMGDFAGDQDSLLLTAYDAADNVIATDTDVLPAPVSGGLLLSVAAPNIAYVRFYGIGTSNNSLYFDSFAFDTAAVSTPEPATLTIFGMGIAIVGARRWRQRR
jgi:hypothetical protein